MQFQQNIARLKLALFVLDIHPPSAENQIACIEDLAPMAVPGNVYVILGPHAGRDKR
jgi:hypothetical protein